jgi:predicted Rossmann fold nucleotide-binding protein DprA/Smf involved in DNA uptake
MRIAAAITGTRQTDHLTPTRLGEIFGTYLKPWATPEAQFYVGGARGIDSLALLWLAQETSSRINVVVPGTVLQQPVQAQQAIERCQHRIAEVVELSATELHTQAYHARNRYMVDRAQLVIGFPLHGPEGASGTWQTINYGATQGKPRLIVPV